MKLKISDKAKNVISTVAPTLGAALGGPLGALAGNLISAALGDGDVDRAILTQNPETLLALRKAEQEFELKLQELGVEKERIAMADRSSAREMAKVNMKPQMVISATFLGGYFLILLARMSGVFDGEQDDKVVDNLLTALTYGVPLILAFWFGSTAGSAQKSAMLANSRPDNGL
jgi:hypothetical protein